MWFYSMGNCLCLMFSSRNKQLEGYVWKLVPYLLNCCLFCSTDTRLKVLLINQSNKIIRMTVFIWKKSWKSQRTPIYFFFTVVAWAEGQTLDDATHCQVKKTKQDYLLNHIQTCSTPIFFICYPYSISRTCICVELTTRDQKLVRLYGL